MQPFSITLFATTGDPEGIRHLDKSNWSGYGVVFNRELFHLLKQEQGVRREFESFSVFGRGRHSSRLLR